MEMEKLALGVSVIGLIFTVHLGVRSVFKSREDMAEDETNEGYDPFNLNDLPLSDHEMHGNIALAQRLSPLAQLLKPTDQVELNAFRQKLAFAGFRRPETMELFNATRATILLLTLVVIFVLATMSPMTRNTAMYYVVLFSLGYYIPMMWLNGKVKQRQEAITRSLPPTLDLLVTCMEAGLNLEGAIERVSKEMSVSDPELSEELQVILHELNAGLSVSAAFKKFSNRVVSDDLKNLCNVIIQSVTLGSSLGRALREYAATARRRREFKLEEEAGKVAAKLTLPLTVCLLPSSMIAMLAPAIVTISRALG
jgi:tight adherence protein C